MTGCGRVAFDPLDGPTNVKSSCNQPVRLLPGRTNFPRLAGLATPQRIGAAWIANDGTISSGGATVGADGELGEALSDTLMAGPDPYTAVSVASNGTTAIGAGAVNGATVVRMYDAATLQSVAPDLTVPAAIDGAHAVTAIAGPLGAKYAMYAVDGTDNTSVYGIDAGNQLAGGVGEGFQDSYLGLATLNGRIIAVSVSTDSATCEIISIATDFQSSGLLVTFGGSGCRQPVMAQAPGRTDFLLLDYDIDMDTTLQRIATDSGGVISMGPDSNFGGGSEPRVVATSTGYWVAVHFSGQIRAKHLNLAGVSDFEIGIATVPDDTSHDVVIHDGEAYAVWLADGLFIEHLCVR